ncbi:hypothetical protein BGW80DRAFT_1561072 [Lactifluus volemus]|nr:hypothetical protein BGW80DRAFT_1561072 [Lactifluus volemus]
MGKFLKSQGIVAGIISNVQENNDHWIAIAADQLSKSEDVIRGYLKRSKDNILLANLTHITRQIFHSLKNNRDMAASLSSILPSLANFDVRNTLPELKHDFGALWDDIEQALNEQVPMEIRDNMLILYDALNGTASSNTCPVLPDTSLGLTSPVHEVVNEDSKPRTITFSPGAPASHRNPSLSISSIPKSTRCPTTDATSSNLTSSCLESHSRSDTSESQVLTTAPVGGIADTPSRGQPSET